MVVAAAVVPAAFGAFVLLGIAEACRLLVQHGVERVLDRAPDERFQVVLEPGFVDLPCAPLSGICERKYTLPLAEFALVAHLDFAKPL